ncbi:Nn.00g095390.m01.CDS01 [Neocucurbitaria sp. VM-36]
MSRLEIQNRKIRDVLVCCQDPGATIDQIAKIRGWFRPQDDSAYYPIVMDYVDERMDLGEASSRLFDPIDKSIAARKLDDVDFMDLWYSIIHAARRISIQQPHVHARIADLVAAFKDHQIAGNEKYNYLYSSLTDFAMACQESYNDAPVAHNGFVKIEVDAWTNANFFFAVLAHKGLGDHSLFAVYALRQALETPHQDDEEATAVQKYDAYVPAAAAWILAFGDDLAKMEKDLTPTDRKYGNPGRGGELWKGRAEFSKERWLFWKERLAEVGNMDEVNEQTRTITRDAVQHMERAETFERV